MTGPDDDADVNPTPGEQPLDERTIEALLSGRAVTGQEDLASFVTLLRAQVTASAQPSSELSALLDSGFDASDIASGAWTTARTRSTTWTRSTSWTRSTTWTRRAWLRPAQVALVGAGMMGLTVGAAAAEQLPGPVQNAVADVVATVTHVQLPRTSSSQPESPTPPAPRPAVQPSHTPRPAATATVAPGTRSTARPGPQTGGSERSDEVRQDGEHRKDDQVRPSASSTREAKPKDDGRHSTGESKPKEEPRSTSKPDPARSSGPSDEEHEQSHGSKLADRSPH